ncbi:UNVERIFIED_CONTAM: hypothetical protein GTU68_017005 [Idotea baltica]|nr:hypothetical protein [Idotea baltica]
MLMAQQGADVVKIEPANGDWARLIGEVVGDHSAYSIVANMGKRAISLNLKDPEAKEIVDKLIADADVFIEGYRPGVAERLGFGYDRLSELNSRLIYVSISGFGQTGPRANQPGYDFLIQGMTGIMDLTGDPNGEPQKIGVAWIDILTGLHGVIGVQAALAERERSGKGQQIDLSLFDSGLTSLANQAMNYMIGGIEPKRMGNAHPNIAPYEVFPAKDGHLIITCGNDRQFASLCKVLEIEELSEATEFAKNVDRVKNREALIKHLSSKTSLRGRDDLISALEEKNVPAGPINRVSEALADPQAISRGLQLEIDKVPGLSTPIKFSRSQLVVDKAAPLLGQDKWIF